MCFKWFIMYQTNFSFGDACLAAWSLEMKGLSFWLWFSLNTLCKLFSKWVLFASNDVCSGIDLWLFMQIHAIHLYRQLLKYITRVNSIFPPPNHALSALAPSFCHWFRLILAQISWLVSPVAEERLSAHCDTKVKLGTLNKNWVKIDILIWDTYLIHAILVLTPPLP